MKTPMKVGFGILAVVILLVLAGTFYTVQEGQQAVIVQFGRPVGVPVTEAGLHVKLEAYKEGQNKNSTLILTTDSDYYRYLKDSAGRYPAR
ncbi:MAG: hypothetical protein HY616_02195 [Candidatus Rokubacteria bacterium]|nr:hypothetical protein [Candidatus Rokubacteria bacterium]